MKIEKLQNPYVRGNEGCSVSIIDLLEKINEIIDAMNGEHDPADIYSEDGRLIAKKDESEDERMIRKIEMFLSAYGADYFSNDEWREIENWLEKQKEQKPIGTDFRTAVKNLMNLHKIKNEFTEEDYDFQAEELLELVEQKPAECIEDSVKFEEGFKTGRESGLRDGQKYVLNNLDSYGLCKVAEWSEEDEQCLNEAIEILENLGYDGEADNLKHLRPERQWKPSEEQLNALNFAITYMFSTKANPTVLRDLYNDLLKLK